MSRLCAVFLLVVLAGVVLVLGGCSSLGRADPAELEATWVVQSFGAPSRLTPADPAVNTYMTLAADKATGSSGVNSFTGWYEAFEGGRIRFGQPTSTRMAGSPAAMAQERAFFKALEAAESFKFNKGKLVLADSDKNTVMVLARR